MDHAQSGLRSRQGLPIPHPRHRQFEHSQQPVPHLSQPHRLHRVRLPHHSAKPGAMPSHASLQHSRSIQSFTIVAELDLSQQFVNQYPVTLIAGATYYKGNLFIARFTRAHAHAHAHARTSHHTTPVHSRLVLVMIEQNGIVERQEPGSNCGRPCGKRLQLSLAVLKNPLLLLVAPPSSDTFRMPCAVLCECAFMTPGRSATWCIWTRIAITCLAGATTCSGHRFACATPGIKL